MSDQPLVLDDLRALVREALGDLLPELTKPVGDGQLTALKPRPASESHDEVETVMLRSDADLAAFVNRLLHLFENPKQREDLRTGRLRFRFAPVAAPGSFQPVHRIEKGAVTEATVREAARSGAKIVLGPNAVLTPLGRDRARAEGVQVEKEH